MSFVNASLRIDIEMSFVDQDDVLNLGTSLTKYIWKKTLGVKLPNSFPVLTYYEALERYGSDKPDIRFDMELQEFSNYVIKSNFNAFKSVIDSGGRVKALVCPNASKYSRKIINIYGCK